jgi:signal transduction histidine kinase
MLSKGFLQSTSVRLSIVYSGLIVTAFVIVGVLTWFAARNSAEAELRQDMALEVAAIRTEFETEGLDAALAAINARAEHPGAFSYWVADRRGAGLAGGFPELDGPNGWRHITRSGNDLSPERQEEMLILTETLPDGTRLSVGDNIARARAVQNAMLETLAAIGAAAVIVCLLVGIFITRRVLSRIETLSATLESVAGGDITARFPVGSSARSDVDRIGAEVNAMLDRIEQLIADVRRVSRDVAHDLRTPLTHLQQRLELARSESDGHERAVAIDGALQKAGEIIRIFDAISRLSEIEAGAAKQRFTEVNLVSVVEKVADAYRPDLEECGHSLRVCVRTPCWVLGDEDLLTQALANLLENAMHHTPAGTHIEISVDARSGMSILEVTDNGPGVARADHERILKPFMRLDQSRTTPGSGLGLSLVAAVARLHGAELIFSDAAPGLKVTLVFAGRRPAVER